MQRFDKQFTELTVSELLAIFKLRARVFNGEQQSSYPDPDDSNLLAHHVLATINGEVVVYACYFIQNDVVTFGRVIVAPQAHGIGLGGKIIEHLLSGIEVSFPNFEITIYAQAYVEDFYKKYGFESVGDHFMEAERGHVMTVREPLNDIYDK